MEMFNSLQGEGRYQGQSAFFIRLAGCDVGCVWCDVKDSWERDKHPEFTVEEILAEVKKYGSRIVVVTGGEPLLWDCTDLTNALKNAGYRTHLETSGSTALSGEWNWICLSPKKFKAPLTEVLMKTDELKVVVYHKSDIAWAEQFLPELKENCQLYLQPEWSKEKEILPLLIGHIAEHPDWILSLQIHKYLHLP